MIWVAKAEQVGHNNLLKHKHDGKTVIRYSFQQVLITTFIVRWLSSLRWWQAGPSGGQ